MDERSFKANRKYILHFAQEHMEFRIPELKSIASIYSVQLDIPEKYDPRCPYIVIETTEDAVVKIMSRAVMIRSVYEYWAEGHCSRELCQKLKSLPPSFTEPFTQKDKSFKIIVEAINIKLAQKDKVSRIENLLVNGIDFGKVDLNQPDSTFALLEIHKKNKSTNITEQGLLRIFFGRWLANGQREFINKYDLRKRHFIANTSMDAQLSLIMANQAKVQKYDIVCDPFVGSGSLLIAAAHFGAYVTGTDIDYKLLHGKGRASRSGQKWRTKDESVYHNLKQYTMEKHYVDVLIADSSVSCMFRSLPLFDAIITDPPYGIREPTKKTGTNDTTKISDECRDIHIARKVNYHISQILIDLLNFSARYLKVGGRLVYWLPVYKEDYCEEAIPQHPMLKVIDNSEQQLNTRISRRLITMEKITESEDEALVNSAELTYDPYQSQSFRDMYFHKHDKTVICT